MNIDGAERYALPGMVLLMLQIRQICVACHDFRSVQGHGEQFRTREFVEQFLSAQAFTLTPAQHGRSRLRKGPCVRSKAGMS